ncbi:hypothetical protein BDW59DRAFT_105913 [Aspergillus cavernicola]|uniref:BHLH domain-containing protein n=1 Tax=Aspergillus cavernicola TaxID=176166 RepID=A0ABR4IXQ4_9EURO
MSPYNPTYQTPYILIREKDQESDLDQSYSPTNFMSSTPPASSLDIPSPIALTIKPSQTQHQPPKRKASSPSTRYSSSSPELLPEQQPASTSPLTSPLTSSRKTRTNSDDSTRGRNAAKRAAHNIIEKRYRTNMNAKFVALEKAMSGPNIKGSGGPKSASTASSTAGVKSSASLKKSEILSNAIAYMQDLQETNERLRKEVSTLNRGLVGRGDYC